MQLIIIWQKIAFEKLFYVPLDLYQLRVCICLNFFQFIVSNFSTLPTTSYVRMYVSNINAFQFWLDIEQWRPDTPVPIQYKVRGLEYIIKPYWEDWYPNSGGNVGMYITFVYNFMNYYRLKYYVIA